LFHSNSTNITYIQLQASTLRPPTCWFRRELVSIGRTSCQKSVTEVKVIAWLSSNLTHNLEWQRQGKIWYMYSRFSKRWHWN